MRPTTKIVSSPHGVLVLDKPLGLTSHAVVARVRRVLGTRKVGHAGTLDPAASGVLVIGVGSATRLLGYLTKDDKGYAATIRFGVATVSDDAEGEVTQVHSCVDITDDQVRTALAAQTGAILQVPSAVSAVKIDGQRAHALVRAGADVVIPARSVTVHSLDVSRIEHRGDYIDVDIAVECSAGTYIRAIARDAGDALGVGGHVRALRRTRSGSFTVADARPLESWSTLCEREARDTLMTPFEVANKALRVWEVDDEMARMVGHGAKLPWPADPTDDEMLALVHDRRLLALAQRSGSRLHYLAVFAETS